MGIWVHDVSIHEINLVGMTKIQKKAKRDVVKAKRRIRVVLVGSNLRDGENNLKIKRTQRTTGFVSFSWVVKKRSNWVEEKSIEYDW